MPEKEIYELIDKTNNGDLKAEEKLVLHNIRLVLYQVTHRFNLVKYDKKDLVSIGIIGLIKAVKSYDVTKKIQFSTYAIKCIDNEILMSLRKIKKDKNIDSLDRIIECSNNDNDKLKLGDVLTNELDNVEEKLDKEIIFEFIQQIVKELPEREREIIMLHFGFYNDEIHTQQEIAEKYSFSKSYISRIISKTIKKLKEQMYLEGFIELKGQDLISIKNNKEGENNMPKTIYKYLEYSKEEVDKVIEELTDEEKKLISLRYGGDLDNPVRSKLDRKQTNRFYGCLIPKMKRRLEANSGKNKKEAIVNQNIEEQDKLKIEKAKAESIGSISKNDYKQILELFQNEQFKEMAKTKPLDECIILSLKLGYFQEKCFSTDAVAEFLDVEKDYVIKVMKQGLISYKEKLNQMIDEAIINESTVNNHPYIKLMKKDETNK